MQAIANKIEISDSISINNNPFSENELIFPSGKLDGPRIRYGYMITNLHFLVPEGVVSELIQNPDIFILPNAPSWVVGLINIRGNIIPVMSLEKHLKIKSGNDRTNILIFNKSDNENAIAIIINGLPVLLEHSDNETDTEDYPSVLNEYLKAGFKQNNTSWTEFDAQLFFSNLAKNMG